MAKRGDNIYKRKDGRFEGRYIKGRKEDGKPIFGYVYSYTYADVRAVLEHTKAKNRLREPLNTVGDGSLGDFMYYWLEIIVKNRVKQATYLQYHNRTQCHIIPALGEIAITCLNLSAIQDFENTLHEKMLKSSTIKNIVILLKSALKDAKKLNLIYTNPCDGLNTTHEKKCSKVVSLSL